ncbi:MAG: hypothetical protein UY10_C0032G0001 [Microgenomates group bacterium GW2011_GWA2_47_8]|nr:MAG: hypothetical protein UY10_C0032G0001 [Microgenomates group bacterium GW2011_GWA2_47_8]
MSLPLYLQPSLWSYNLSTLDPKKSARTIITQVLNYGDERQLRWLFSVYDAETIREMLLHPSRGVWLREKLRKWLGAFHLMTDPLEFESAILDLTPRVKIHEAFFQRKELVHHDVSPKHIAP